ncbi:MAG TPA: prolipoprotein diacylglyceryl transferase [Verrucomicrobiae bacterium]|nr:prolipoprotein diacylglyceryl transferase [Verrucomicrobiae bacterium]
MHPEFIRLGPLDIHTYGVFLAIGCIVGLAVAARRARREGIDPERIADLGAWLIVAGMLGGKLFHIIFFWDDFIAGWRAEGLRSLREGFVFYGGFIAGSLAAVVYARRKQLPVGKLADILAPSVALGHAFGRLGCFFNGCCFGRACTLPWAVRFPPPHVMAGIPVHPTELYEVLGNLVIFAGLSAFFRHRRFEGQIWWLYVLSYGVLRFVVDFFRGDYATYYFGVLTIGQLVAMAMIVVAATALVLVPRRMGPRTA